MENRTNRKQQLPFVCCKWKTEMANFLVFAADRNGSLFSWSANNKR